MIGTELSPSAFLDRVAQEFAKLDPTELSTLSDLIFQCYQTRATVFICGNGGSGSNASHFCEDLGKQTIRRQDFDNDQKRRLRVLSLTDNTPYILAWANDEGYDRIFVEQLKNLANPGDLLIAISGSGNSPNVLRAIDWANQHGLTTFGCTGFDGGQLRQRAQFGFHVPMHDMGVVESIHLTAFHWVIDDLFRRIGLST
ncbi:MAG: phosphoheptose isomerase [Gemmatales bacterium]|nr:MAG: phosphoheptose isomerase [Gemmatales bacterium]